MNRVARIATLAGAIASAAEAGAQTPSGILGSDGLKSPTLVRPSTGDATVFTGSIVVTLTITIASGASRIARTAPIKCVLNVNVNGNSGPDSLAEVAQVMAPIDGSQASCRLSIPYSWSLVSPAEDYVNLSYGVSLFDDAGNGRNVFVQMPSIGVPAGGTTAFTKTVRI